MNLRRVRVKSGRSYRQYSQLVESYRPSGGGNPRVRVLAGLGALSDIEHDNLRCALAASRQNKRVAILPVAPRSVSPDAPKAQASLRYLDVAVLLEIWRRHGFREVLEAALTPRATPWAADVLTSLILQRCVCPASKLKAVQWFPKTALPQLLDLPVAEFNNTRVHRALDNLQSTTPALMARLANHLSRQDGAFASLFIDVTDTWFCGQGPDVAQKSKTKEGLLKRKIGIVLMCNEHGEPVRWEVCEGKKTDNTVMADLIRRVSGLAWLAETPVVCDRAMGQPSTIAQLANAHIRFVTALPVNEFERWQVELPKLSCSDEEYERQPQPDDLSVIRKAALQAGLRKVSDTMYLLDVGKRTRLDSNRAPAQDCSANEPATVRAMRLCLDINQAVADDTYSNYAIAGANYGLSKSLTGKYRTLGRLPDDVQQDVLAGQGAQHGLDALIRIAKEPTADQQRKAFAELLETKPIGRASNPRSPSVSVSIQRNEPVEVRAVAYFNPEVFLQTRTRERRIQDDLAAFVETLNQKAHKNPRAYRAASLEHAVLTQLKKYDMVTLFQIEVVSDSEESPTGNKTYRRVVLHRNERQWQRRRRYDGYSVIVVHPDLPHGPEELCRLYRSKDCVEKDFQTIKGIVQLRPIRHRTTPKVRAHVTICILSLLLERRLKRLLGQTISPAAALTELEPCRLNEFHTPSDEVRMYTTTALNETQHAILSQLNMTHLADDAAVCEAIAHHS